MTTVTGKRVILKNLQNEYLIPFTDQGGGSGNPDGETITLNNQDQLQTIAVKDNRSSSPIKIWTGTRAQYDTIITKDPTTLYNITDDFQDFMVGRHQNIGEIISSTLPLTDAGLHLLDGSVLSGGGIYHDFVDYIANVYTTTPSTTVYNYTAIGNLYQDNGIISNFSTTSYAYSRVLFSPNSNSWELKIKFQTGYDVNTLQFLMADPHGYSPVEFYIRDSKFHFILHFEDASSGEYIITGQHTVQANSWYSVKLSFSNNTYSMSYSTDDLTYVSDASASISDKVYSTSTFCWGVDLYPNPREPVTPFLGAISIPDCYLKIDNKFIWLGSETKKNCFITEDQWQAYVNQYGVCGKFVYDPINNTVRLPKITGFTEGTITPATLGNLTEAGLPNITGGFMSMDSSYLIGAGITASGAFDTDRYQGTGHLAGTEWSEGTRGYGATFDASSSNIIYGNSNTVQPQSIKVLYYIVVATVTKTDIEVDIDEIVTDLAGKADVDLTNVDDTAKIFMSGMGMLSDRYIDLTVGASNTQYTAPANGWFCVKSEVVNKTDAYQSNYYTSYGGRGQLTGYGYSTGGGAVVPMLKGQTLTFYYEGNTQNRSIRFIYAKGSESEAS